MGESIESVLGKEDSDYKELVLAAREAMGEDSLSQSATARKIGISVSTYQAWLAGTYKSDVANHSRAVQQWLRNRRTQQIVRAVVPPPIAFVSTPTAQTFMGVLNRAQYEPTMVTITGEPGIGKTVAIRAYKERNTNVHVITATRSTGTVGGLLDRLCNLVGEPEGAVARRNRMISKSLRGTNSLIVIDEAQLLSMDAIDELRMLHDDIEVQVGIALVGHPDLRRRMLGGGKRGAYAQLTSRFGAHIQRTKVLGNDVEMILDAEEIEDGMARKLLRAVASEPGGLREMKFVLRSARMLATETGAEAVIDQHISAAHQARRLEMGSNA